MPCRDIRIVRRKEFSMPYLMKQHTPFVYQVCRVRAVQAYALDGRHVVEILGADVNLRNKSTSAPLQRASGTPGRCEECKAHMSIRSVRSRSARTDVRRVCVAVDPTTQYRSQSIKTMGYRMTTHVSRPVLSASCPATELYISLTFTHEFSLKYWVKGPSGESVVLVVAMDWSAAFASWEASSTLGVHCPISIMSWSLLVRAETRYEYEYVTYP